ncbi:hypothetical protein [Geminicoccus flavidas]|uniref:hypothetical protein n=1 Tax=Geminicoccus flavidas TaxID=2506407 RepID=UPI00135964FE|nr:hypothetical protein [Geminicoccus flavidas]
MGPLHARLFQEHVLLTQLLIELMGQTKLAEARYVQAILKTDAAEMGWAPKDRRWLRPGQPPEPGWTVYEAVWRWCQGGYLQSPEG